MDNLYILTTAIVRPNVHKKGIAHFINLINLSNRIINQFNKIYFIINLDNIQKLDSTKNIKLLHKYNKKTQLKIFENKENPCFLNAFKNVFIQSNKIQEKESSNNKKQQNIFLWLEDDWFIQQEKFYKYLEDELIKFKTSNFQYLTTVNSKPSGPPFFFKQEYFNHVIYYINNNKDLIIELNDPEIIMLSIWKNLNNINEINNIPKYEIKKIGIRGHLKKEDLKYPILFIDSGKNWAIKNNLKKWNKKKKSENGFVSYKPLVNQVINT